MKPIRAKYISLYFAVDRHFKIWLLWHYSCACALMQLMPTSNEWFASAAKGSDHPTETEQASVTRIMEEPIAERKPQERGSSGGSSYTHFHTLRNCLLQYRIFLLAAEQLPCKRVIQRLTAPSSISLKLHLRQLSFVNLLFFPLRLFFLQRCPLCLPVNEFQQTPESYCRFSMLVE